MKKRKNFDKKKLVKVELTESEIGLIIDELEGAPHDDWVHFKYSKIVDKLNFVLEFYEE